MLSVRIQLSRNLSGLAFSPACSADERCEVERLLTRALSSLTGHCAGKYLPLRDSESCPFRPGGMTSQEEQELGQRGLLFQEPKAPGLLALGFGRDWPEARGVFAFESPGLAAWVNEEDHLLLVAARSDGDLKAAFAAVCDVEFSLRSALEGRGCSFARSDRLGYLTALPEKLGTGLSVALVLEAPKLAASPGLAQRCADLGLEVALGRAGTGCVELRSRSSLMGSDAGLVRSVSDACAKLLSQSGI
ncbi:unnamed protein product [Polarella glacialis]|nr:unnamed protein product [Polarella glacialis]